jgi:TonB-linked SusC/RagA family outer membrane protein
MHLNTLTKALRNAKLHHHIQQSPVNPPGYPRFDPALIRRIIMRINVTAFIIALALLHASAKTYSQVTLHLKNAPIQQAFSEIKKQTNLVFLYQSDDLQKDMKVTVDVNDVSIEEALTQLFKDLPVTYTVEDQTVLVKKKEPSFLENLKNKLKAELSQTTVTGKVVDGTGQPIPGVNVKEKGTQNGTTTDSKGKYTLSVASDKSVVTFSYIGYETQELAAMDLPDGSTITLKAQENNLHEVVISKGYYNEKQELSTSDISVVSAKTIEEQPVSDPIQALIGRVPGLNIQQTSGVPGSYATIQIRGQSSIANGNDPLYIIDGVPFSSQTLSSPYMSAGAIGGFPSSANYNANGAGISPFSALNPEDIEDIEILKDADATAIYGSRGANGVILITTKKGKAGATKFTLDANQGAGQVGHFMDLLNTQQYLQMRQKAYRNDGVGTYPSNAYDINGVWDTTRYTNWQKVLIGGTAQWTNINGDLSGGNANTQFLIGGGYNRQTTVYPGDYGDTKKSFHASITSTSNNQKFHAVFTASYVNDDNVIPTIDFTSDALTLAPDAPPLNNANGSVNWQMYNGSATFINNPIALSLSPRSQTSTTNNLISNLDLSYQLLPGLVLKSTFGYNHDEMNETQLLPDVSIAPPNNTNPNRRTLYLSNSVFQTWNVEPQLSYNKKIGKGTFNALMGTTFEQQQTDFLTNMAQGFTSDALITDPSAASTVNLLGANTILYRYNAVYARIGYDWEQKYLLNVTARRDGSSRFGPDKQFGTFGAVGIGWIFSKEKFFEDNMPWLNFGKLRGSYGLTGNDKIGDYQYLSSYSVNPTTYQGITQLLPNGLPNSKFSWETDKKLEGGVDLGFLKDRIDLSMDYYRNRSSNQLIAYPLPTISGFTSYLYNLPATVQNTGLEAELHTVNFKQKDFSWTTGINFTFPENKLVAFPGIAETGYASSLVVGQPLSIAKVYDYTGVNPQTGLYTFATQSANGVLNSTYDYVIVNPTQKFYGGMQNSFNYKNLSLDIFIQFVNQLGKNYQVAFKTPGATDSNEPVAELSAWQTPGQVTNVQRYYGTNSNTNTLFNSDFKESSGVYTNTSFVRLENVALSYRLPSAWQQWAGMHNAKFYINGQNLYTFTKYIGLDPETGSGGLPPLRMITAGVHAEF